MSTISALNTLIQKQFDKGVINTLDQAPIAFNWMKGVQDDQINSQSKSFPVQVDRGGTLTGAAEFADFPSSVNPVYDDWLPQLRYVLSTISFSHRALKQNGISGVDGNRSLVGIGKELGRKIDDEYKSWLKRLSAACYRDGKGKVSSAITAITTGTGGTFTVDPATADYFVDLFSVGTPLHFYTSGGTQHNTGASLSTVTAVNRDTGVVTCDDIPDNAVVGDFPVYANSWDLLPNGFEGNIQSQDTTINGLDVTGLAQLKSLVQSRSGRAFSIKDVNLANVRAMRYGGVNNKLTDYAFFMNPTLFNSALNEAYDLTSMQVKESRSSKVDMLYDTYEIGGKKVHLDNDAPRRQLIAVKKDTWRFFYALKPGLVNDDGKYLHMQTASTGTGYRTGYDIYMAADYNIVCLNPAANYRLTEYDISDTFF